MEEVLRQVVLLLEEVWRTHLFFCWWTPVLSPYLVHVDVVWLVLWRCISYLPTILVVVAYGHHIYPV